MKRLWHRATLAGAASIGLVATFLTAPSPAVAAPPGDCPYPYVCVYNSSWVRTGAWRDVTSGWQTIRSAPRFAYNSRHDDVAYFRGSITVGCVMPGRTGDLRNIGTVTGIRIATEAVCFP